MGRHRFDRGCPREAYVLRVRKRAGERHNDLDGYIFTNRAHAERWIEQDLIRMSSRAHLYRVDRALVAERRCGCGMGTVREIVEVLERGVLRPPQATDDERRVWNERMREMRRSLGIE